MRNLLLLLIITTIVPLNSGLGNFAQAADVAQHKYGPDAATLSESHTYFLKHTAPGFWRLMPYYVPQQDGSACSLASIAMLVNAARAGTTLNSQEKLVTQPELLKKVKNSAWKKMPFRGVSLDEIGPLIDESLKAYGITAKKVEVVHTEDASLKTKAKLHEDLLKIESSGNTIILANFIQGIYTGDAQVGHFAPLAAYDAESKRVLVMDPDREWYEPYWVSEETLLNGMNTPDKQTGHKRGYAVTTLK
jgi:hypothetical protein